MDRTTNPDSGRLGRPAKVPAERLDQPAKLHLRADEAKLLRGIAAARFLTVSELLRRLVRGFLRGLYDLPEER